MKWHYTFLGFLFDLFDWVVVGSIPLLGDVVDIIATAFWYMRLGPLGLVDAVELIPFADVLPTNIVLGYLADHKGGKLV